jgi:hypothetical protein
VKVESFCILDPKLPAGGGRAVPARHSATGSGTGPACAPTGAKQTPIRHRTMAAAGLPAVHNVLKPWSERKAAPSPATDDATVLVVDADFVTCTN